MKVMEGVRIATSLPRGRLSKRMNPVDKIIADRVSAQKLGDPNADICFLALSLNDQPSLRTLVLRGVNKNGFTLFVNKTSEKWRILKANNRAQILLWFSSLQRQYRVNGILEELEYESLNTNWAKRPIGSKYLDHAYTHFERQSMPIDSHASLIHHIHDFKQKNSEESLDTPKTAAVLSLIPNEIEMLDLNDPDRLHDRRLFKKYHDDWITSQLMP